MEDMDRLDGAFSLMLIAGAASVLGALFVVNPEPLVGRARVLLRVEAVLVAMAGVWAVLLVIDPEIVRDDVSPAVAVLDACWPLHQLLMLVVGIAGLMNGQWPSPARYALFGPWAGLMVLGAGASVGPDLVAAIGIGAGWAVAGAGVLAVTSRRAPIAVPVGRLLRST
jgi:hypothetical protein